MNKYLRKISISIDIHTKYITNFPSIRKRTDIPGNAATNAFCKFDLALVQAVFKSVRLTHLQTVILMLESTFSLFNGIGHKIVIILSGVETFQLSS